MTLDATFVLWLIMLALVVAHLVPIAWPWGKFLSWSALALLTVVLVLVGALHFVLR